MSGERTARVAQVVQEALMEALTRGEIKDPRVADAGLVTITHVEVSGDLRHAKVYFVVHGGDGEGVREGLTAARGFLRRLVGERMRAKAIPELRFFVDDGYELGQKIERLLAESIPSKSEDP
jgi:ribosome-binding factor A